jgi:hypothetical protein
MEKTLEQKIQSEFITDIKIKQDNIESFKAQFRR